MNKIFLVIILLPIISSTLAESDIGYDYEEVRRFKNDYYIQGISQGKFGLDVLLINDFNGDGKKDLVITTESVGKIRNTPSNQSQHHDRNEMSFGSVYVIFDIENNVLGPNRADKDYYIDFLIRTKGVKILNDRKENKLGQSVASGDFNADGLSDILIGTENPFNPDKKNINAEAYIVFGSKHLTKQINVDVMDKEGIKLIGFQTLQDAVQKVTSGDINGDGIDDMILGVSTSHNKDAIYSGTVYVIYGSKEPFNNTIDVSKLNGKNGFSISGKNAFDYFGSNVEFVGDINNDGQSDLMISALGVDRNGKTRVGATYTLFSKKGSWPVNFDLNSLDGKNGFVIYGKDAVNQLAYEMASAGDMNQDGIDDVMLSSIWANNDEQLKTGEVYVIFGQSTWSGVFNLSNLNGKNGFTLTSNKYESYLGYSLSVAGDINADGLTDIVIGAPDFVYKGLNTERGNAYLLYGSKKQWPAVIVVQEIDGVIGRKFKESEIGNLGMSVSPAGDINNDGIDDFIIAAPREEIVHYGNDIGVVYFILGKKNDAEIQH